MTKGQKTALFIVLGLLLLLGIGYYALKSTVDNLINSQESRTEIARLLEDNISGIIAKPSVSIASLRLSGLSQINIGPSTVSSFGVTHLNATGYARCSIIKLMLSGVCAGELFLDFGSDGRLTLKAMVPKKAVMGSQETITIRTNGTVEELDLQKLTGETRKDPKQVLQVNGGRLSGKLSVTVSWAQDTVVKGNLTGTFNQVELTANVAGKSQRIVKDIPISIGFDANRLFFEKPLAVAIFGLAVQYSGDLKLNREAEWNGTVTARGKPLALNYTPVIFRCKKRPKSVAMFRIKGPVSGPECG